MLRCQIIDRLLDGLADTHAVLVNGTRETGKSTLMKSAELAGQNRQYLTFDDPGVLAAAKRDLSGFVPTRFSSPSFEDPVRANDYLIRKELWRLAGDESHVLPLPGR
jgi:hypothetical protein